MSKRTTKNRPRKPPRYVPLTFTVPGADEERWLIQAGFAPYMYKTVREDDPPVPEQA